jgi:uncharacterized protein with HEPN domain
VPPRDWRLRLDDIDEAIRRINRYVDGMTQAAFHADERTVDAVIRNFQIIGEAAKHLPEDVVSRRPDIPWSEIRSMRNILVHQYFGADVAIVWKAIEVDLPALADAIATLRRG